MVAQSLWKVVFCLYFFYSNGWQPCHYGRQSVVEIFVTLLDGSLVIMHGSLLSIYLLLHWIKALSLWKVVCCDDFFYSNGWQPCHYGGQSVVEFFFILIGWKPYHYGRQSVVKIFVIPMDGNRVILEGSLLLRFLLLSGKLAVSLQRVLYC